MYFVRLESKDFLLADPWKNWGIQPGLAEPKPALI
jgi:hypothetical protein